MEIDEKAEHFEKMKKLVLQDIKNQRAKVFDKLNNIANEISTHNPARHYLEILNEVIEELRIEQNSPSISLTLSYALKEGDPTDYVSRFNKEMAFNIWVGECAQKAINFYNSDLNKPSFGLGSRSFSPLKLAFSEIQHRLETYKFISENFEIH